jgi:uncharacterized protein (DUF1778 family)
MPDAKRRKTDDERKGELLKVRVNDEQKRLFAEAAARDGLDLSSWVRFVCLRAAKGERLPTRD